MSSGLSWVARACVGLSLLGVACGRPTIADEAASDPATDAATDALPPFDDTADAVPVGESGESAVDDAPASDVPEPTAEPVAIPPSRVRVKLDVQGELFAPAGRDAPPIRRPIDLDARFDFIETPAAGTAEPTVGRRYIDATAELRVDGEPRRTSVAADARSVKVVLRGTTPAPFLEGGFLTREERDLLETPFDVLLVDALRPADAVAVGGSWEIAGDVVAGLLAIDTVESGGMTARLESVADGVATVTISGIVDGAVDGVPAHVTIEGSFSAAASAATTADAVKVTGRVVGLGVTLRERREASHVAPGFDVEARLSIARTAPDGESSAEPAPPTPSKHPHRRQGTGRPGLVWHRDEAGRYDLVHDDRWRAIEDGPDGLVMRLVDSGALVAQCAIIPLPRGTAGSAPTIVEVERDIERSLAGQFGRIEHASEAVRSDGVRIVRVVTAGRADGLPFRWIHCVLVAGDGERLAVTCMLEASMEKRFARADRELVDGVGLPAGALGAGESATTADDREARLPRESRMP